MDSLKTYGVYVKVFVLGENEDDALDSVFNAVDGCDLLDQDAIVGVEVVEDLDDIEEIDEESEDEDE